MADEIRLWFWQFTDEFGKRRRSTWRMTEEQAALHKDAEKVYGSLEVRRNLGFTSDIGKVTVVGSSPIGHPTFPRRGKASRDSRKT